MTEQALISTWLEQNGGPRRFEGGASSEFRAIQNYLAERGYRLSCVSSKYMLKQEGARGRPRQMRWHSVLKVVDEIRTSEGREPMLPREVAL